MKRCGRELSILQRLWLQMSQVPGGVNSTPGWAFSGLFVCVCFFELAEEMHQQANLRKLQRRERFWIYFLFFGKAGRRWLCGCLLLRRGFLGGLQRVLWPAGGRRLPALPDAGQPRPSYPLPWLHHRGRGTNTHPGVFHLLCSNVRSCCLLSISHVQDSFHM